MLKIIGVVLGYLLCGVGVLELIRLHDRHTNFIDQWLNHDEEIEQVTVVALWPIILVAFLIPWLIGKFIFAVIRVVQLIFTTLTYMVVALIKKKINALKGAADDQD